MRQSTARCWFADGNRSYLLVRLQSLITNYERLIFFLSSHPSFTPQYGSHSTIPDEGGNTNFNQANVHVKANKGSAIFFSYMDPIEKIMDYGFTTHSGCPVFSGEKKIVTQWVRYGVNASVPHSSYNTLNILHTEARAAE
jgi:hypothetical protein